MLFDEKTREIIKMCRCCFMCRHACPVFLATKLDSHTPRGYAINLSRIDEGIAGWDESGLERLYHCTQCGLCKKLCAFHWSEDEMVLAGRRAMVSAQRESDRVKQATKQMPRVDKNDLFETARYDKIGSNVLYIAGSALKNGQENILKSAAKLFSKVGEDWTMLRAEDTGGPALYELGYEQEYGAWEKTVIQQIQSLKPGKVVTSCAHTLSLLRKAGVQAVHMTEYISSLIQQGKLALKADAQRVMYHDPCHLGREFGVFDAPRTIIRHCCGADAVEFHHSRDEAECCGAGAAVDDIYPEIALRVAQKRMEQAEQNSADVVVTACPNCARLLGRASNGVPVLDLSEYIAKHI